MRRQDFRLLPLAVGVWGAALLCVFWPAVAGWTAAGCGVGAVVAVAGGVAGVRGRRDAPSAGGARASGAWASGGLAVLLLAAMAATAITVTLALPARELSAESAGRVVEVTGTVTSSAAFGQDGRLWFEAQSISIGIRGEPTAVSVPVRVGVEPGEGFDLGAEVRVLGEAETTDAGERSALVVFATEAEVVRAAEGVFGVAAGARQAFIARATRLPEPGAGLLPGLAVGDTRAVSEELNADMRSTGLSHLTAVSGDIVGVRGGLVTVSCSLDSALPN